jgi:O-acetylserine/cysteine efflux transporter
MAPRHIALAVLVAALWGFNFVAIKVGLDDVPPLLLSALRYALAALVLVALRPRVSVPWRWIVAVGVIIGVVKFSLLFIGMDVGVPAGLASLVLQAQAFFTLLFAAVLLGERPRRLQIVGMALAFAGISLMSSAVWSLAALVPTLTVIEFGVIRREEGYLEHTFGGEYRAYRERTRRWL